MSDAAGSVTLQLDSKTAKKITNEHYQLHEAIPGVHVSMVTGDRELSSTRTVAHRARGRPMRNSHACSRFSRV